MSPATSYTIHNLSYSKKSLINHAINMQSCIDLPSWEMDIWLFICEWLNDSEMVTLKTSGSTGQPKVVSVAKQYLRNSAAMTIDFLDLKPQFTALLCLPAAYIAGKMMIVRALEGGMNLIYAEPSGNPLLGIDAAADFAAMIPLQVEKVLNENGADALANIKHLIIGGAAVSSTLAHRLLPLPNNVWATYGMTETVSHVALKELSGDKTTDFFTPLPGVTLRTDARGCLTIDAPHLSKDIVVTNDIVDIDNGGQFCFVGRFDNVINSGGVKMVPEQIEAKIKMLIDDEFLIVPQPDERLGHRLVLLIESSNAKKYDKLPSQLKEKLSSLECPKAILFKSQLQRTQTGKLLRKIIL